MIIKLIAIFLLIASCSNYEVSKKTESPKRSFHIERSYASVESEDDKSVDYDSLYNNLGIFHDLIEENYTWREKAVEFYKTVRNTEILSNEQIVTIHEKGTMSYLNLRDRLYQYITGINWVTNRYNKIYITHSTPTVIIEKKKRIKRHKSYITRKYQEIHINPADEDGKILTRQIKMGLIAALALYDNYIIVVSQFAELDKLRHLINFDNSNKKYGIAKITRDFNKLSNYKRMSKALNFHKELKGIKTEAINPLSYDEENFLNQTIENSHSYKDLNKRFRKKIYKNKIIFVGNFLYDYFKEVGNNIMNLISKGFGNTVGLIQSRDGKLYNLSKKELTQIEQKLRPLDVLLEKTPFRLTDRFIPGHWGHVAIWVGSKSELVALDLWDHPIIKPHQQAIEFENRRIIEALRPGVQINTLKHFMNIDDLAILRPTGLSDEKAKKYLTNAFKQVGKDYDFNFDVETDEKIVCSELAYVTFNDIEWNTSKAVGRYTISPDNVGEKVSPEGGEFEAVILYHDGKEVKEDLTMNFLSLMKTSHLN